MKPLGYNVKAIKVNELEHEQLVNLADDLLKKLKLEVWLDETPVGVELILAPIEPK